MKKSQYVEGDCAVENFEEGMKTLFKAPKAAIVQAKKKKLEEPSSLLKPPKPDKD